MALSFVPLLYPLFFNDSNIWGSNAKNFIKLYSQLDFNKNRCGFIFDSDHSAGSQDLWSLSPILCLDKNSYLDSKSIDTIELFYLLILSHFTRLFFEFFFLINAFFSLIILWRKILTFTYQNLQKRKGNKMLQIFWNEFKIYTHYFKFRKQKFSCRKKTLKLFIKNK